MHSSYGSYSHLHVNQYVLNKPEMYTVGGRKVMVLLARHIVEVFSQQKLLWKQR